MASQSIRKSLRRAIVLTTGGALAAALVGLVVLQIVFFPREAERRLSALGDVVALYAEPAIAFQDMDAGNEALRALGENHDVTFGAIVLSGNKVFATEGPVPPDEELAALVAKPGTFFHGTHVDWVRELKVDGKPTGRLILRGDLSALVSQVVQMASLLGLVCLLSMIGATVAASRLRERIARPLAQLATTSEAMARGDLTRTVEVSGHDEIGSLASSFRAMGESLRMLVSQVRSSTLAVSAEAMRLSEATQAMFAEAQRQEETGARTNTSLERVGSSVVEVSTTVDTLAESAADSNTAMSEIDAAIKESARNIERLFEAADGAASSVLEMTAAVKQIAANAESLAEATGATLDAMRTLESSVHDVEQNARESYDSTSAAAERARRGEEAVDQTIAGMATIAESFDGLQEIVADLEERSQSIHEVSQVIQGVVEQTNLLALNAAIISSQAGEHGKAFSVVAQEVKGLADRTSASTQEIASSITSVLSGVESAVKATADGAERVRQGRALSAEAGQVLREIREGSERSSAAVEAIVAATASQSQGIRTVSGELDRVKELVDQITSATHEQSTASSDIQRGVEAMRQLAEDLKRATHQQTGRSRRTTEAVDRLAAGVAQIRDATQAQRGEVSQILEDVQVFLENAAETTRRADSMKGTATALNERAGGLSNAVGRFEL